ncbi:hypothetical protein VTJ04DRAFT_8805 [Mycothermus thermophilus]|uniref:uncharacterized protein n=1 Tax=Humicola insolens TaxID=85995 RepID=UPI00374418EA
MLDAESATAPVLGLEADNPGLVSGTVNPESNPPYSLTITLTCWAKEGHQINADSSQPSQANAHHVSRPHNPILNQYSLAYLS